MIVPTASWTGSGSRPVIDYAVGTQGLAQSCAPSSQLQDGTEYETANIVALLKQGWAVVVSDYQGYTTGSQSLYTVGAAEGHAVLDAATAADQVPGTGLSSSAPTAIWGYSQGGQAAAWAGQLQSAYDPSLVVHGAQEILAGAKRLVEVAAVERRSETDLADRRRGVSPCPEQLQAGVEELGATARAALLAADSGIRS